MMRLTFSHSLELQTREHVRQTQELVPDVSAISEGMAGLLGAQREIWTLLGKPSLADEVWGRLERRGR